MAFDLTPLQNGNRLRGIGRYVEGLGRRLAAQRELPIEFWGWDDPPPFEIKPPHRALWLPRLRSPRNRWSWLLAPIGMRIRRRLSRVSMVHITDPRAYLPLPGITLTTVYDLIPLLDPESRPRGGEGRAYRRYLDRLKRADGLFAISTQTADDLRAQLAIPPPTLWIAPPGVERPPADDGTADSAAPYFLYIGSPGPHKNLAVLIEAFSRTQGLPERLVLVGSWYGPNLVMLKQWLTRYGLPKGRVSYEGFVPDLELRRLIRGATAVVIPSRREGFGLPLAETLAAGGVAVHSRIAVLSEVAGPAALSFDPASPQELAEQLSRVSRDPQLRAELRALGLERAAGLSWQPTLELTLAVYRDLPAKR